MWMSEGTEFEEESQDWEEEDDQEWREEDEFAEEETF